MQWFWCLHCQRAFESVVPADWRPGQFVEEIGVPVLDDTGRIWWSCPYDGCGGSPIDFIPWERMREDSPGLPAAPAPGAVYPARPGLLGTIVVLPPRDILLPLWLGSLN
jgi:hypothetical protein